MAQNPFIQRLTELLRDFESPSRSNNITDANQPAAVLVPIIQYPQSFTLVLTVRNQNLTHHAGQISFPGGRMDESDSNLIQTALRETYEEIGIVRDDVEILGQFPPTLSKTGFMVTPVVGLIQGPQAFKLQTEEVTELFEVPIDVVLQTERYHIEAIEFAGQNIDIVRLDYDQRNIWGLTAKILQQLCLMMAHRS